MIQLQRCLAYIFWNSIGLKGNSGFHYLSTDKYGKICSSFLRKMAIVGVGKPKVHDIFLVSPAEVQ